MRAKGEACEKSLPCSKKGVRLSLAQPLSRTKFG
jgi:hypothetical protein